MTSGAAARASGYVGGANALSSGMGQYLNYSQNQALLNRLSPQASGGYNYTYADPSAVGPFQPIGG